MVMGWSKRSGSLGTAWVALLVMEPRLGQILRIPWLVNLLVPAVGLDKLSRALKGCGLSY